MFLTELFICIAICSINVLSISFISKSNESINNKTSFLKEIYKLFFTMFIRCYADLNFGIKSYLRVNTLLSTCKLNSYIIVDISNPPLNPSSSPPTQLTNIPGNITIENLYPPNSVFTQMIK